MYFIGDQARYQTAISHDIDEAKDICIKHYVIFLIKENIMTWYFFFNSTIIVIQVIIILSCLYFFLGKKRV
jgi:hypothetical protein